MDKHELIERLMVEFLGEIEERVSDINVNLLALEKEPNESGRAERYKTLFRAAHSMKGAARTVEVNVIEEACHLLEEILIDAQDGVAPLDTGLFALLFATADAIQEVASRLREHRGLAGSRLSMLLPRLEAAVSGVSPPSEISKLEAEPPSAFMTDAAPLAARASAPAPAHFPTAAPATVSCPTARHDSELPPAPPAHANGSQPAVNSPVTDSALPSAPVVGAVDSKRSLKTPTVEHGDAAPSPPIASASLIPAELTRDRDRAFVRVPAEKLDALLTRSGELLVARRQVESWTDNLTEVREFVFRWKREWRGVMKPLAKILIHDPDDKDTAASSRCGAVAAPVGALPRRAVLALRQVGDNLRRLEKDLDRFAAVMASEGCHLNRAASLVDEEVRRVRMLPFVDACHGLERVVRDVARVGNKEVELVIEGGELELDRSVLEGLKDPLCHLVRNAVDHGLETTEKRLEAGKPAQGRVMVSAALRGIQVEVIVTDDGKGLDSEAIRLQAHKQGLVETADDRELAQFIFHPGFSTAPMITNISGRGVGLDVVKSRVEALHGSIDLASEPGRGTRFTLAMPLTLTTLRVLLVSAAGQIFALASTSVQKLLRVEPGDFRAVQGREMLALGGPLLPVVSLGDALGGPPRVPAPASGKQPVVVVAVGDRRMAFVVDELLDEQEVVVKGLGPRVRRTRDFSGATILPSGRIALVLNAASLVRTALGRIAGQALARRPVGIVAAPKKRLLVVDDSITTRTLEKSILEAAGYEVSTAVDGEAGWQLLREHGADLLLSDIEMPRMDGFALTETVRASKLFSKLPIVLFTSLGRDRDRARGIEVGADAYIVKGAFDQKDLLETISQLL